MQNINLEITTPTKEELNKNILSKLKIVLKTEEDDSCPIYISGNFNNWRTQDKDFMMDRMKENLYHYEFKNHFIFPDEFEIPQLNKTRKIWALLPHDYDNSTERYPVMYLQDAQNLFNEDSPCGNWEIDKKLAVMAEYKVGKIIIIAIEHGDEDREKEYDVGKTVLGKGQGKNYIKFISETLKPFVDNQFRTKPEREFTGIGGSSLGGLISIFCGLMYPKMYGKLMVFSPSLWVSPKLIIDGDNENNEDTKIYLYAGGDESENLVEQVKNFKNKLKANELVKDKMKINISINMEGKHNESYWSDEFPKAIEWLYFNTKAS